MHADVEKFSSGWFGIQLRFRPEERDALIEALRALPGSGHFHLRAIFSEVSNAPGIADVEVSIQGDDEVDNLRLDA